MTKNTNTCKPIPFRSDNLLIGIGSKSISTDTAMDWEISNINVLDK